MESSYEPKRTQPDEVDIKLPSGVSTSTTLPFDEIPPDSLRRLAVRYLSGHPRHGKNNWHKGVGDREYQMNRYNHAMNHLLAWSAGDTSDDHLGAVMWWACCQMELERREKL